MQEEGVRCILDVLNQNFSPTHRAAIYFCEIVQITERPKAKVGADEVTLQRSIAREPGLHSSRDALIWSQITKLVCAKAIARNPLSQRIKWNGSGLLTYFILEICFASIVM